MLHFTLNKQAKKHMLGEGKSAEDLSTQGTHGSEHIKL